MASTSPRDGRTAALRWDGRTLQLLDQTRLPREEWLTLTGARDTAEAIRRRAAGAGPLPGIAAAYGLAMEVAAQPGLGALERGADMLRDASSGEAGEASRESVGAAVAAVHAACLAAGPATIAGAARGAAQAWQARHDVAPD